MKSDKVVAIHSFPVWLPQTQTWMYNQVKYLPENIEIHVVCDETENLDQFYVPNIHSLRDISRFWQFSEKWLRKLRMRSGVRHLTSVIKKLHPHLVHSHFGHIGWTDLVAAQRFGVKQIVTFYGADVNKLPTKDKTWVDRYQELFSKANAFLCEGPFMAAQLVRLGCPIEKVCVHHLGIEVENIPFKPRTWKRGEPLRVLIASAFREKKGVPDALRALAKLQHMTPLEITLIGDAGRERSSQAEKQSILNTIDESGLGSKIRMLGFQPYAVVFQEAYKHHVFLSPSVTASDGDTEGGAPVSIIEMIATGMPVVSTAHCDIPEVVRYGIDDWLVEEHDVAGLVGKLTWLIEHPAEWEEFLLTGRNHVEDQFNAAEQGKKLASIYKSVLG